LARLFDKILGTNTLNILKIKIESAIHMTLILTETSPLGIAMAADSAVT
jgi:hypothetical protein